jgi:hypothetical protein
MLQDWPGTKGVKAFEAAKQALIDAHEGILTPIEARAAFLAAAKEAQIFAFKE